MRTRFQHLVLVLPLAALAFPTQATAQWGYPAPAWRYAAAESHLRLRVTPADASVYVDGYLAGTVSDFDGRFQRLRVVPGEHEIVVYLAGYRSLRQRLYLGPNSTRTVEGDLQRLQPGEPDEQEPEPLQDGRFDEQEEPPPMPPPAARVPRRAPAPPQPPVAATPPYPVTPPTPGQVSGAQAPSRFAVLSFTVDPERATLIVDGQRHDGPSGNERVLVQVEEGHHVIDVERRGYESYRVELDVKRGETVPVTVSLRRR